MNREIKIFELFICDDKLSLLSTRKNSLLSKPGLEQWNNHEADVKPPGINSGLGKEENRDKLSIIAFYSVGRFPFDFGLHFVIDVRLFNPFCGKEP